MVDFPFSLILYSFLGLIRVVFRAEGPPTSITLSMPLRFNLMAVDFTMLVATVYSPTPSVY
jgi:hypothetical protein